MEPVQAKDYQIVFENEGIDQLNKLLKAESYSSIFVLVDSNTHEHCLARFLSDLETEAPLEVVEIDAGEEFKNLETCSGVWAALSELGADRKSLMINLGGGVVTDLGGFVASAFRRGIDYINVPTTLLSMVDASVGGKTGVDLGALKNQIGVISNPKIVLVEPYYLGTLPRKELRSGFAEMLKHGLISDEKYWEALNHGGYESMAALSEKIRQSIVIKNEVVLQDPTETGLRKILNFGHTLGHAIESHFMDSKTKRLLHGEAIAIGMILAGYLSSEIGGLPAQKRDLITESILHFYEKVEFEQKDIDKIIDLLKYDKKNSHGKIYFVLLDDIGQPAIDKMATNDLIINAFEYYRDFEK